MRIALLPLVALVALSFPQLTRAQDRGAAAPARPAADRPAPEAGAKASGAERAPGFEAWQKARQARSEALRGQRAAARDEQAAASPVRAESSGRKARPDAASRAAAAGVHLVPRGSARAGGRAPAALHRGSPTRPDLRPQAGQPAAEAAPRVEAGDASAAPPAPASEPASATAEPISNSAYPN